MQTDLDRKSSHSGTSCLSDSKASASSKGSDVGVGDRQLGDDNINHKFRSGFFQAIEELRMRRTFDVENEERIRSALNKNHLLMEKLEEEKTYSQALIEKERQMKNDIKLQFEEKIKQAEYEKAKKVMMAESCEQQLKALKDEMKAKQLVKYDLEKKLTERECQLRLQTSSRDSYLSQMNQLDHKHSMLLRQADKTSEQLERLEDNFKESKKLHVKLQYVNEHRKCELEFYKNKLKGYQAELMQARVRYTEAQLGNGSSEEEQEQATKWKASEQELKMQLELNKQLQAQLLLVRNEHQEVLSQLKDAHSLIERHVDSVTSLTEVEGCLKGEVASLNKTVQTLTLELDTSAKTTNSLKEELSNVDNIWNKKYKDIDLRLEALKSDYTFLQESHNKHLENKDMELEAAALKINSLETVQKNLQEELHFTRKKADAIKISSKEHTEQSDDGPDYTAITNQDEDLSIEANTRDSVQTMGHTGYSSPQPTASCWPGHTPGATQCEAESVNDSRVNLPGSTTCPNVPSTNLCYSPEFLSGSPDSPAPQAPAVKQLAHPVVDVEEPKVSCTIPKLLASICLEKLPVFLQKTTPADKGTETHSTKLLVPVECNNTNEEAVEKRKRKHVFIDNQTDSICQTPFKKQKIFSTLNSMEAEESLTGLCVVNDSSESPGGLTSACVDSACPGIMAAGDQSSHCLSRDHSTHCLSRDQSTHCLSRDHSTHCLSRDQSSHCLSGDQSSHCLSGDHSTHCLSRDQSSHCLSGDGVQPETAHDDHQTHLSTAVHSPLCEDDITLPSCKSASPDQLAGQGDLNDVSTGQGAKTNLFSIVFSEDEDDQSSLNKQIDKVHKFLKKDRLRRPKAF